MMIKEGMMKEREKEKVTEKQVREVFRKIMTLPDTGYTTYAKSYADAGLAGKGMTLEELKVQCLYVLNNLQQWRGEEAREAKRLLKDYAGVR
jgi:hypothetical protein